MDQTTPEGRQQHALAVRRRLWGSGKIENLSPKADFFHPALARIHIIDPQKPKELPPAIVRRKGPLGGAKSRLQVRDDALLIEPQPADDEKLTRAQAIVSGVCRKYGITREILKGASRRSIHVAARQEAIYRIWRATGWSLPRLGRFFGDRNHTTILHSLRKVEARLEALNAVDAIDAQIEKI